MVHVGVGLIFGLTQVLAGIANDRVNEGIVSAFIAEPDLPALLKTQESWKRLSLSKRVRLAELFATHLPNRTKVGVKRPADLIISSRVNSGELKLYGHGWMPGQDLFLIGGKAAWAISELMAPCEIPWGQGVTLPELDGTLPAAVWDQRVAEIKRYVSTFREVAAYLTTPDYRALVRTRDGWLNRPVAERVRLIEVLEPHLLSPNQPGLTNHRGLNIPSRLKAGQLERLEFYNDQARHDLFMAAGRSAWTIEPLIKAKWPFPDLTAELPERDRDAAVESIRLAVSAYLAGVKAAAPAK